MKQLNKFVEPLKYSIALIYRSSGLLIVWLFFLSLLLSSLSIFGVFAIKYIINIVCDSNVQIKKILLWIILYVLSLIVISVISFLQQLLYDVVFKKAEHLYDCEICGKRSVLSMAEIDSSKGRDKQDDVMYCKTAVVYSIRNLIKVFSKLYIFFVSFIILLSFNKFFSILFLCLTIPGIILNQIFDKKAENIRIKQAPDVRKFHYYRWMLTDAWPAKDVRMYDLTDYIKKRYDDEKQRYINANKKLDKDKLRGKLFTEGLRRLGECLFVVFVVNMAIKGEISIGDVTLYVGLAHLVGNSFQDMLWITIYTFTRLNKISNRVIEFFSIKTDENCFHKRKLDGFKSLTFNNVYFKYPYTEKYVLTGVSFTLNKGDKLSIVGINGSGKSTIIKLMLGLYEIESGQILINGYPMSDYDIRDVRKLFSALFQSFVQYPLTLRENIALSSLERIDDSDEIESVLRQSGVYEDIKPKLENGLDSFMTRKFDDKGTELSKGQWQKIALSRAYFKNAPIIIFDEPSAALDAEAEDRIFKNFESISDGKTGIMISHRISSARMSNKIIVLDGGKITEQGSHEELVSLNGLYAKLYNLQREKYTIKEGD